ncbi:Uncharacterized protein dnm_066040 [Desulfonema magnum]|uniref:Uncharacterized protein n=1 Tax=Desulfonema magnum TaxID=45655 RepID=A0A975BRK4_9BACT|nr:Uncharacterized protein dnm_066040 [Desulfonema magnum]
MPLLSLITDCFGKSRLPALNPNAVDLRVSEFSGILSGVRKMLFHRRKNIIFALRIRSELSRSTALALNPARFYSIKSKSGCFKF